MDALVKKFQVTQDRRKTSTEYTLRMIRTVYGGMVADKAKMLKVGEKFNTPNGDVICRKD